MSKYVIDSSTLSAIGDAIRVKTETTELILTEEMASKILGITTGGGGGGGDYPSAEEVEY